MEDRFHCLDCGIEFSESEAEQANYRCPDCGAGLLEKTGDVEGAAKKKMGKVRVFSAIFALLGLAIFFVWQTANDKGGGAGADNGSKAQAIDQIIKKAMEVNGKVPLMIDKSTRLDRVVVEDKTIIYKTTLVNLSAQTADKDIFKKKIGPYLAEKYCNDKNSRKALELGIKYGHEYFGINGALLYSAHIGVDDC
jgi:DNA-directed RNA polymerase subunit RPC12/RpoP